MPFELPYNRAQNASQMFLIGDREPSLQFLSLLTGF